MLINLWNFLLLQPLFNFLIWIYNNLTDNNFGWTVVYLTIALRMVLLPFTLIDERNKVRNRELSQEIHRIEKIYQSDPILKKEQIRKILRNRRVQPWATAVVLAIQAVVLLLLYQVFLQGLTGEKILKLLYPAVSFPGVINIDFYGFDLGKKHDLLWPGIVAVWLFIEIYFDYKSKKGMRLKKSDLMYFVLFPAFVFMLLWWLPMVKSLFILTSMAFSLIISQLSRILFSEKKKEETH